MLIQALIAELSVEALDEGILHRLPRRDEVEQYPVAIGPASSAFPASSGPLSIVMTRLAVEACSRRRSEILCTEPFRRDMVYMGASPRKAGWGIA